ncbi:unnamed protein product [Effrenium voratum]|nr:unnamed protein product [Effrenium voratum]
MSEHIRFGAMDKQFFFDKARPCLTREASEAVFKYFLLGERPGSAPVSNRLGLVGVEERLSIKVRPSRATVDPKISALETGRGMWRPSAGISFLYVILEQKIQITRVELLLEAADVTLQLSIPCTSSTASHVRCLAPTGSPEIDEFRVICKITTRPPSQQAMPAMTKITVFGRRADKAFRKQCASQMAEKLIKEVHHESVESAA